MKPKAINIVAYDGVNLLDVAGPAQVFAETNTVCSDSLPYYELTLISKQGGLIRSNCGIPIDTAPIKGMTSNRPDTLIIAGGTGVHQATKDRQYLHRVKTCCTESRRFGSVCTGAFLLAATGLLDGKRAVTHWQMIKQFQAEFPLVKVETDPIFICDDGVWTSAGVSAGVDLALAMVEQDLGHKVSLQVAQALVVYLKRPGGQSQFSAVLQAQANDKSGIFGELHSWLAENLEKNVTTQMMAEFMNMSPRNFFRLYKKHLGITPAKSVEHMRLERAKRQLERNTTKINRIAHQCGFVNPERMRRVFIRNLGISPAAYRHHFGQYALGYNTSEDH